MYFTIAQINNHSVVDVMYFHPGELHLIPAKSLVVAGI